MPSTTLLWVTRYITIGGIIIITVIAIWLFGLLSGTLKLLGKICPNGTVFTEQLKTLPQIVSQITAGGIARSGSSMAITVIMMIPPIVIYLVTQSNVVEGMSSAGIKE